MKPTPLARGNLGTAQPDACLTERFETLVSRADVRIERILSRGQASPPGFWYAQPQHEWVLVVSGSAVLEVDGEAAPVELGPGDWLDIPARRRHRVLRTSPHEPTLWLAIHYGNPLG